jgi:hypothetical protein
MTVPIGYKFTEAFYYSFATFIASVTASCLLVHQQQENTRENHYSFTLLDLSGISDAFSS